MKNKDLNQKNKASYPLFAPAKHPARYKPVVAITVAALLLLAIWQGVGAYLKTVAIVSTVDIDAGPGVQLKLNAEKRVREAAPLNDDGKTLLDTVELKDVSPETAIRALMGEMKKKNHLCAENNTLLLTVSHEDPQRCEILKLELSQYVSSALDNAAILSQTGVHDGEVERLADTHAITHGKAQLIRQLCLQNSFYTFEVLSSLSLNELNLLSESGSLKLDNVSSQGSASDLSLAGEEAAKQAVFDHAGTAFSELSAFSCKLDLEGESLVYEIEFVKNDTEYEYKLEAYSLELLKTQGEAVNTLPPSWDESPLLTEEEALAAALEHSGVAKDQLTSFFVKADRDDGIRVYEIRFATKSTKYEYELDASTGKVLKFEKKARQNVFLSPTASYITKEQALAIVLAHAALTEDQIQRVDWESAREHQTVVYEIDFESDLQKFQYHVNAFNGNILFFESEQKHDTAQAPAPSHSAAHTS